MMVLRDRGRRETEIETEKVIERKKRNLIELKKKITIPLILDMTDWDPNQRLLCSHGGDRLRSLSQKGKA